MQSLSSTVRHDLRTPLNHLIGYGEMLLEAMDANEETGGAGAAVIREIVARAREQAHALQSAITVEEARESLKDDRTLNELYVLSGTIGPDYRDDVRRMQQAAERLLSFVAGGPDAGEHAAPPREAAAGEAGSRGTILGVDDNPDNRQLLQRMLEREGYSVTIASSGDECLNLLRARGFDLVLLDVMMTGMNGFDVLKQMRESETWQNIPVIVISALDENSAAIRCIQMGAEDYVPKPFDTVLLRARIGATLEKKRLRDKETTYARELEQALDDLRRAQDRLVTQEKLASLGQLTAGIAHELKNPLNFINNFAQLAKEAARDLRAELGKPDPDTGEVAYLLNTIGENVDRIENHGKRADRIVRGMLLHARAQSGPREPADVNALVAEAVNLAYHGRRAHDREFNVDVRMDLDASLPSIPVRTDDISRVLLNVANNAFDAMAEKQKTSGGDYAPRLLAKTRMEGDCVAIEIEDNGNGIPAEAQKKIFDPFFTTKPAGAGTGLGLSISFDVVRAHDGSFTVESEPGRFARFRIVLPKAAKNSGQV